MASDLDALLAFLDAEPDDARLEALRPYKPLPPSSGEYGFTGGTEPENSEAVEPGETATQAGIYDELWKRLNVRRGILFREDELLAYCRGTHDPDVPDRYASMKRAHGLLHLGWNATELRRDSPEGDAVIFLPTRLLKLELPTVNEARNTIQRQYSSDEDTADTADFAIPDGAQYANLTLLVEQIERRLPGLWQQAASAADALQVLVDPEVDLDSVAPVLARARDHAERLIGAALRHYVATGLLMDFETGVRQRATTGSVHWLGTVGIAVREITVVPSNRLRRLYGLIGLILRERPRSFRSAALAHAQEVGWVTNTNGLGNRRFDKLDRASQLLWEELASKAYHDSITKALKDIQHEYPVLKSPAALLKPNVDLHAVYRHVEGLLDKK